MSANEAKDPKYAPAREDGKKPFVVTTAGWGRTSDRVVYALTAADARGARRLGTGEYITNVRRALFAEQASN